MIYVADTHTWVFYLLDKLPNKVDEIFSEAELGRTIIFIPTIVLAECIYLVERRKIDLDLNELFSKLKVGENFVPASLTIDIVEKLPKIPLPEIHDRIIVATAQVLEAKLLTRDEHIVKSGIVETIWD
ncbi:MAG: PIN domain-containing protein [Candidatus Brockarchaeota archaeon]|nr:PIN domain-containing protein [Candidatus Brockarchaeota archaeon]